MKSRPDNALGLIISWPKRPTYAFSHMGSLGIGMWWAHQDSNLEPKDYESSALTIEL